ncbi:MarR family winged helix-turn-helix transcriptional regulator [Erythrobacter sp. HA6-11]
MSSPDPLAFKVFNEIGIIDQLATHAFTQALPRNMTVAQFGVLNHFVRLGHAWQTPAQLAEAFQVARPTMSNTLARMDKAGLVEITSDPEDGRSKRVSVTNKGRAVRADCVARLAGPLQDVQQKVPRETLEKLDPLLTQLREILDEMRD